MKKVKQYNKNNYTERKKYFDKWAKDNPDKMKEYRKKYKEPKHIVRWRNLLTATLTCIKKEKWGSTRDLLQYSALDLKEHLDSIDKDWLKKEVDHIVPMSWFINETPPHIINDLRNLSVLTKKENQKKSNKFSGKVEEGYYNIVKQYLKEKYKHGF